MPEQTVANAMTDPQPTSNLKPAVPLAANDNIPPSDAVTPFVSEQLLIDFLASQVSGWRSTRALVVSPGRAQGAASLAGDDSSGDANLESIDCWYIDLYAATLARHALPETVDVSCTPDMPDKSFDLVALAVTKKSESELTRDMLIQAHKRLEVGGRLVISVDHPKDVWLQQQLQPMFDKVTRVPSAEGVVYSARKTVELKKEKEFWCDFPYRDEEARMLTAITRPGVFSHRRLDPGARQLMRAAEVQPDNRVLDFGCGAGVLAVSAAFSTKAEVFAVDANARAIQCTELAAKKNGRSNVTAILNADGQLGLDGSIDLVLANPPYFGGDAIPRHFVDCSIVALRPGGALLVVTKKPSWYSEYFDGRLDDIVVFESGRYFVACGRKSA